MAENTKKWEEAGRHYRTYIKLEKRLAQNTVEAYMRDLRSFAHFILRMYDVPPAKVEEPMVQRYVAWLYDRGREKASQARSLSGVKSFFNFLLISDRIESSPAEFVLTPKFGRHLPDVLTTGEIDRIIAAVDGTTPKEIRDAAMLEVLYSCGLRVSELTSLRIRDLFFGEGYIRVTGKGDKDRQVYFSVRARLMVQEYMVSRKGGTGLFVSSKAPYEPLKPRAIQRMVRAISLRAGLDKRVHPHLLRHDLHDPPRGGPPGRHREEDIAAHLPALVRYPPARGRGQHPAGAGAARPREHPHHGDLHTPGRQPPAADGRRAPPDLKRAGKTGRNQSFRIAERGVRRSVS